MYSESQSVAADTKATAPATHAINEEPAQPQPSSTEDPSTSRTDHATTTIVQEQRRTLEPALPVDTTAAATDKETDAGLQRSSEQTDDGGHLHLDNEDTVNPPDFQGDVLSNNELPSVQTIERIRDYIVLDRHGKTHTFRSLYTGRSVARRVLIIFVRHFYCGNCQEYLRALSASIHADSLLHLPMSTFIAVIGCGDPALIDMYAAETGCPFPIYTDPTRKLYAELGMIKTLALGARPAYMSKSLLRSSLDSIVQGVKQIKSGLAIKGGDQRQIGGEFLFEPVNVRSPDSSPVQEFDRSLGGTTTGLASHTARDPEKQAAAAGVQATTAAAASQDGEGQQRHHDSSEKHTSIATHAANNSTATNNRHNRSASAVTDNDNDEVEEPHLVEEKKVTWCHRMRNTRDHAEIPELMEILGLTGQGQPSKDQRRWSKALETRKGTGLSLGRQMNITGKDKEQEKEQGISMGPATP
ncbi:AhpC/TSA antioxidant enzyme-domain-containing protein [Coniella lustricola]|uniref:AhpC/TSA antioxidant enzyme-domain-containing protein n=1 Tax=Coniella lustricola TaxID=2025994 RepID=A0A2T3ACL1_9PEZI|nr:AhpC/TSA antioxidant enzyme-domain-containing protein [Coniella lustricola]